jgi:hypothetical protein
MQRRLQAPVPEQFIDFWPCEDVDLSKRPAGGGRYTPVDQAEAVSGTGVGSPAGFSSSAFMIPLAIKTARKSPS